MHNKLHLDNSLCGIAAEDGNENTTNSFAFLWTLYLRNVVRCMLYNHYARMDFGVHRMSKGSVICTMPSLVAMIGTMDISWTLVDTIRGGRSDDVLREARGSAKARHAFDSNHSTAALPTQHHNISTSTLQPTQKVYGDLYSDRSADMPDRPGVRKRPSATEKEVSPPPAKRRQQSHTTSELGLCRPEQPQLTRL